MSHDFRVFPNRYWQQTYFSNLVTHNYLFYIIKVRTLQGQINPYKRKKLQIILKMKLTQTMTCPRYVALYCCINCLHSRTYFYFQRRLNCLLGFPGKVFPKDKYVKQRSMQIKITLMCLVLFLLMMLRYYFNNVSKK